MSSNTFLPISVRTVFWQILEMLSIFCRIVSNCVDWRRWGHYFLKHHFNKFPLSGSFRMKTHMFNHALDPFKLFKQLSSLSASKILKVAVPWHPRERPLRPRLRRKREVLHQLLSLRQTEHYASVCVQSWSKSLKCLCYSCNAHVKINGSCLSGRITQP